MNDTPDILCIGSVLWDIIGRTEAPMKVGADQPGHISRQPGGVAMNIAVAVARFGMKPAVLTAIGRDREGDDLTRAAGGLGVDCQYAFRSDHLPTDRYMAIEAASGLMAALADARSLEAAGDAILAPLADGRLGFATKPWPRAIAIDGNLPAALVSQIATSPLFAAADLRLASASPTKALRLAPLLALKNATLYLNIEEAGVLCGCRFDHSAAAAAGLVAQGVQHVLVTNGGQMAADGIHQGSILTAEPPQTHVAKVTGAGDTFMAAHLAADIAGADRGTALDRALEAAAAHVAGDYAR
jgi:sugar/nucleoside kinase (ribokinase family)